MILFLNKVDLLQEKIATSNLARHFATFRCMNRMYVTFKTIILTLDPGPEYKELSLYEAALKYFEAIFIERVGKDTQGNDREV